jgi:hypothetical protein
MGRWEEGVGGRGGSTLELDLYDHFLAGASAGGCNTYLDEGRVGVDLGEGEERQGGKWPRAPVQPALWRGVSARLSPISPVMGRRSRAQTGKSFFIAHAGVGARRC